MISLSYLDCFYSSVYVKTKVGWSLTDLLTLPPQAGIKPWPHPASTLQCLWADFQAVFELRIKVLKEMYFASWAFANNSLQFPADCSACKYIMWGWGFLKTLTCVCFLQHLGITLSSQQVFPWNSKFLSSLQGGLGGFSFISFPCLSNFWRLLMLVHGGVRH